MATLSADRRDGWGLRGNVGSVRTVEDADGACLEIAPDAEGRAANLQRDLPIVGRGFQSLLLRLRWRIDGTAPGDASWKRAVVQARYLKGGREFGNWISLGGGNGTTA